MPSEQFTCADGTVLLIKPVSARLVQERGALVQYPEVPKTYNTEKEREEPNPMDPDFLKAYMKADEEVGLAVVNTYLGFGTSLVKLGADTPDPDDDWDAQYNDESLFGDTKLEIPSKGTRARYVWWLTHIVLNDVEITAINDRIAYLGGSVKEGAVKEAMDSFRSTEGSGTDKPVATNRQQRRNRDRVAKS